MTDWEIRDMIATRPTEAFAYIKHLQKELERTKAEERIADVMCNISTGNPISPEDVKAAIDRVIAIENMPIPDYCDG